MLDNRHSLIAFSPYLVLTAGVLIVLGCGLLFPRRAPRLPILLSLATLVATGVATYVTANETPRGPFGGLVARDGFGDFFLMVFAGAGLLMTYPLLLSREIFGALSPNAATTASSNGPADVPDLAALTLAIVLGAGVMAIADDLLVAYLALEFVSLLSYALTALSPGSRRSSEAALKYAIYGGVASGCLLYGFSLLYGLSGGLSFAAARAALLATSPLTAATIFTLLFAGLGFKIAVVPFHMWAPDVYEGAPTPVAAFFSVVPKAAGFALAYRFLQGGGMGTAGATALVTAAGPASTIATVVGLVAALTMTLGNLAALGQRNIKRLLAYSSIGHAGTVFLAFAAGTPEALQAIVVYTGIYLFMNLAAFLVVIFVIEDNLASANTTEAEAVDSFAGLGRRAPVLAFCLTVALFSLTGLPPLGGFVAKYALFSAVLQRGLVADGTSLFVGLALVGVLNTVVSLYYYARIVKVMYFRPPANAATFTRVSRTQWLLLALTTIPTIALGLVPGPLTEWAARIAPLWSGR